MFLDQIALLFFLKLLLFDVDKLRTKWKMYENIGKRHQQATWTRRQRTYMNIPTCFKNAAPHFFRNYTHNFSRNDENNSIVLSSQSHAMTLLWISWDSSADFQQNPEQKILWQGRHFIFYFFLSNMCVIFFFIEMPRIHPRFGLIGCLFALFCLALHALFHQNKLNEGRVNCL